MMIRYFIKALKNYATFSGRARRKEYWYFFLCHVLALIVLATLSMFTPFLWTVYMLWALVMFLPGLSLGVRRMHDVGKSGWYLLIPFYSLVLVCTKGDQGTNAYGADPKADKQEWDFEKETAL
jgi:uncharacterized membrane protein YhaH (DUF805 family)